MFVDGREVAASGDLSRRIPVAPDGRWQDEDARLLATTFNSMTDSIEKFQREAAHPGGAEDGLGSHLTGLGFALNAHGAGAEPVWKVDFPLLLRALIAPGREHSLVVVKMDIEGAEYDILRAMLADGSIDLVDVLHVEFHHRLMPAESAAGTETLRAALRERVALVEHW